MWISHLSLLLACAALTAVYCRCWEGGVRLVNGETVLEGRVEICSHREWGNICGDSSWDSTDASVVCRQLGFSEGLVDLGQFGRGTGSIHLGSLRCHGGERRLIDCTAVSDPSCDHSQDAGVRCQPNLPQNVRINTDTITDTSIVLTWQPPPPVSVLPDHYNITLVYTNNTRSSNQTHTTAVQVLGTATRLEYNQLLSGLDYSYCVSAIYGRMKSSFCYVFQTETKSSSLSGFSAFISALVGILCFVLVLFFLLLVLVGIGLAYPRCIRSRIKDKKCLSSISRFLDERIYITSGNPAYLKHPQPRAPSTQVTRGSTPPGEYEMLEEPSPPPVPGHGIAHRMQMNAVRATMKGLSGPKANITGPGN